MSSCLRLARKGGVLLDGAGTALHTNEVRDTILFLGELLLGLLDAFAEPVVDLQAPNDLVGAVPGGAARHGEDKTLLNAVGVAVSAHSSGEPVALRGGDHFFGAEGAGRILPPGWGTTFLA